MRPNATIFLLILTSAISLLEVPIPGVSEALAMIPPQIIERPLMLITALLVHLNIGHLLQNLMALAIFGTVLERVIKPCRMLSVYIVSGIAGNIAGLIFYPDSMSLGASGAIMGIVGALAILRPKASVWFGVSLPIIFLSVIFMITDLAGLIAPSDIGNAAHLAGFFSGAAFGWAWRKKFSTKKEIREKVIRSLK